MVPIGKGQYHTMGNAAGTGWDLTESLYFEKRGHVGFLLLSFLVASFTIGVQGRERERKEWREERNDRKVGGSTYI